MSAITHSTLLIGSSSPLKVAGRGTTCTPGPMSAPICPWDWLLPLAGPLHKCRGGLSSEDRSCRVGASGPPRGALRNVPIPPVNSEHGNIYHLSMYNFHKDMRLLAARYAIVPAAIGHAVADPTTSYCGRAGLGISVVQARQASFWLGQTGSVRRRPGPGVCRGACHKLGS